MSGAGEILCFFSHAFLVIIEVVEGQGSDGV